MFSPNIKTYLCLIVIDRLETIKANLERALPFFDEVIVVDGGSKDGTLEWLVSNPKIHVVGFPWCDNFALSRNNYLAKIGELRSPDEVSIYCRCDDDEFYSTFLLENIKTIAQEMVSSGINIVSIRSRSVTLNANWDRVKEVLDDFWKPLIHVWEPGLHYERPVHETLITPSGPKEIRLQDFSDTERETVYEHIKKENVVWSRGVRNFFINGGGVPPQAERQFLWKEFLQTIRKCGEFYTYRDFEAYMARGKISQEIKDWMVANRRYGLPSYDARYTEIREVFLTYFVWYHPEELPNYLIDADRDYMDYVVEAKKIHGDAVKIGAQ